MYGHPSSQFGNVIRLDDNRRTRIQASIKRGSAKARRDMGKLDRELSAELEQSYRSAADDIRAYLTARAGDDNTLRLEVMRDLLAQAETRLGQLETARNGLLDTGLTQAASTGVSPFAVDAARVGADLSRVADEAVRFTVSMVAQDGLQLSDRLWNIDNGASEAVAAAIQRNIIQGHGASQAAQELLARGEPVPRALAAKMRMADADRIGRILGKDLMTGEGSAYANALRVFRTEINRAHGEAYQAAAFEHPDVIGTQFLLSPRHPETDICDMHARVNRYGLGPGVYPMGENPWPAHPNTLSFTVVVFADEVTADDRSGKEDRITWLKRQDPAAQSAVLGSRSKQAALGQGVLRESEINTPWRVLKKKYQKQGIDITGSVPNAAGAPTEPSAIEGVIIETRVPADFPIGATKKQASDITRRMVDTGRARDYQKNSEGLDAVRFKHTLRDSTLSDAAVRRRVYNQAHLQDLDVDTINAVNKELHRGNQVADTLGIPHIRGASTQVRSAIAKMGDGVLSLDPKSNNRHFKPRMAQSEAIKHHEKLIERKKWILSDLDNKMEKGELDRDIGKEVKSRFETDMRSLEKTLNKLREGVPVYAAIDPPSQWTPGSALIPPHTTDGYFSFPTDKFKTIFWHEFAHHIHQQLGVNSGRAYFSPPLESDLAALFAKPNKIFPSKYSRRNPKEWFAESYSLYRLERSELIDEDLLALIHRIERGEYNP